MPYVLFLKRQQILNCRLLQIIGGALRVKTKEIYLQPPVPSDGMAFVISKLENWSFTAGVW